MKNILNMLPKKLFAFVAIAAITFGVLVAATTGSALIGGDREVRPYTPGNTPGFEYVTFNSFTGVPNIGDERDFFNGKISEAPNGFYDPMNGLRAGDEILMRVYVHNNADTSLNASGEGVAKNTRVRVNLPTDLAQSQKANAFISADNATPKVIEDTLSMTGEYPIQLEYVAGSANLKNNFQDKALSDDIVKGGVLIGDDSLDGNLKGCFEYVSLVTFKVKVKAPSYTLDKKVKVNGTDTYTENVSAKAGQKVDYVLAFKNVGSTNLSNVVLGDRLPENVTYVPGTTEWLSAHTSNKWTKVANDNLFDGGIEVGNYGPNGAVYVRFTAIIDSEEKLECGLSKLINTGYAKPKEHGTIEDKANVTVNKDCEDEKPGFVCKDLSVEELGGRKVKATVDVATSGDAQFKSVTFNYGDGSDPKMTSSKSDEYTYTKDGTFNITTKVVFTVDGKDRVVEDAACTKSVTFKSGEPTPEPELPSTGAGSVVGLFAATSAFGAVAHNVANRRRNQ